MPGARPRCGLDEAVEQGAVAEPCRADPSEVRVVVPERSQESHDVDVCCGALNGRGAGGAVAVTPHRGALRAMYRSSGMAELSTEVGRRGGLKRHEGARPGGPRATPTSGRRSRRGRAACGSERPPRPRRNRRGTSARGTAAVWRQRGDGDERRRWCCRRSVPKHKRRARPETPWTVRDGWRAACAPSRAGDLGGKGGCPTQFMRFRRNP